MAEATSDGSGITLKLSLREAALVQVLVGAAVPGPGMDTEMYGYANDLFHEMEDHLHDPDTEEYWNRVYDALGDGFEYSFEKGN